jgi:pentatricopeptide repeat protein
LSKSSGDAWTRGIDAIGYTAAIAACQKAGEFDKALAVLDEMQRAGVVPDRIAFNAAIGCCAAGGAWGRALQLMDRMTAVWSSSAAVSDGCAWDVASSPHPIVSSCNINAIISVVCLATTFYYHCHLLVRYRPNHFVVSLKCACSRSLSHAVAPWMLDTLTLLSGDL